jgi:hypothetical protein
VIRLFQYSTLIKQAPVLDTDEQTKVSENEATFMSPTESFLHKIYTKRRYIIIRVVSAAEVKISFVKARPGTV